jgi:hypothetical protein
MAPVFGRGRGRRCSVEVGVRRASVGAEARWCQSPRFSASLIGLRVRVCGGAVGTVNVGSRAPADPSFIWRCARGGPLPQTAGAPDQGASRIGKPIQRSLRGDHFPNTYMHGRSTDIYIHTFVNTKFNLIANDILATDAPNSKRVA